MTQAHAFARIPEQNVRPIASITPYENNSRIHPASQIEALARAIDRFGFTQPIVIDEHGLILAGHGRYAAALKLGLDHVPTSMVKGLSAKEKKAYIIADNKIAEQSAWDYDLLLSEIASFSNLDFGSNLNELLDINTFVRTKVEQLPIDSLKEHPKNYKKHPKSQIEHIKQSIAEHGIYRNIIVCFDGTILAGHGVYHAAIQLGMSSLPCLRVDLDPVGTKALKLLTADNEISHIADSNARELTDILQQILVEDDLLGTGYDKGKLEALLMVSRSKDELQNLDDEEWDESVDFSGLKNALKCIVSFENEKDRVDFFRQLNVSHTDKTKSVWWPPKERESVADKLYVADLAF